MFQEEVECFFVLHPVVQWCTVLLMKVNYCFMLDVVLYTEAGYEVRIKCKNLQWRTLFAQVILRNA